MRAKLRLRKAPVKGFGTFYHNIMKRAEKGKSLEEQSVIKKYLLGVSGNEAQVRQIEEKILLDDDFAERLTIAEDELIDDYLNDNLTDQECSHFINFFLISSERREKLRLIQNLNKAAAKTKNETAAPNFVKKNNYSDWLFNSIALRFAAVVLIVCGVGYGVWRTAFYKSDVDRGLAELRQAFRGERPVEPRLSGFDYAPLNAARGENDNKTNVALERAEGFLLHAAAENPNAESFQALGKFYLTEKKFDKAIAQFERAAILDPDNARLQNDFGAALLETGKNALLKGERAKGLESLDKSLNHLEKAVALEPKMVEARFNRALALQSLDTLEQAKQAWREYLEIDANSDWSAEARRNLQILESKESGERSAAELESDFLTAMREKNEAHAWQILSRNRELIREKYLPQRLAMSFLQSSGDEREEFLRALQYVGELEERHNADPFASEIASFYKDLPEEKINLLKKAQQAVRNGYELCLKLKYREALIEFDTAHNLFAQIDDVWEAKLSEYFTGYCLVNTDRAGEALEKLEQLAEFAEKRNYKWLEMTALYWAAGSYRSLKQRTESKRDHEKALAIAEQIEDSYALQRNLLDLARHHSFVGQKSLALDYLQRVLEESNKSENSLRQKYRNYADGLQILIAAKLYDAAKPTALEAVSLADRLDDRMFQSLSRSNAGIAFLQTGDFNEARKWLDAAQEKAALINDESSRKKMAAYAFLKSGNLERRAGDYEKSAQFYDQAIELYETMEIPTNLYEAQKGKLMAFLALGKDDALERQIPVTLKLTEDYRDKILEEQERTSFFDNEESIYDIAVDYEFRNGRYEESYNYAESSNSRSLLDWLEKGAKISSDRKKVEILLEEKALPTTLSEIRERMPDNVQILQYSVLEDKILIWLISKEKFVVVQTAVSSAKLREKVENYVKSLQPNNFVAADALDAQTAELYDLLIKPIIGELDAKKEICLIPNKALFYLPFAALSPAGGKPLLADYDIFYAPSANVFLVCTENARKKIGDGETLLSVGNPAFDHEYFEDLPDLPAAENEAREITAFYSNSQTLFGREATKTAFQNAVKNADIIHFAGHYVVAHDAPLSSYLLLAQNGKEPKDDTLTNLELITEKLPRAKLVVLSACQTGVEQYYNGEGMIGLSRTFLAAGAPLVVASQWSVDSEASAELMKRFHFFRSQKNMTTAAALRSAQMEMLNDPTGRFRQPFYWAAFAVFGGYTTF